MPYLLSDRETGSIEGPLQPHPLGTRLGGVLRCATNADCRLAGKPQGGSTPIYGQYRYVPRNRVWFLRFLAQGGYSEFQVTGMIEGFFLGLKFSIPGIFGYENLASIFLASLV